MDNILKKQKQLFQRYLSFHEELLKVQVKNMQRLVALISFQKLNKIDVDTKIINGHHIITPKDVLIEEKELEHIFDEILPVIKKYFANKNDLNHLDDLNDKRKLSFTELVQNVLTRNDAIWNQLSQKYELPKSLLKRIGSYISSPYLELCSEYFSKKIQSKSWEQANCPICGSQPSMALTNERENTRQLWCELCDTVWDFAPIICPFCFNKNLHTIKHIFPPETSANRVDACDSCKYYIKVVDIQLSPSEHNLIVDNISTFHLDVYATMCGYKNNNSENNSKH